MPAVRHCSKKEREPRDTLERQKLAVCDTCIPDDGDLTRGYCYDRQEAPKKKGYVNVK